MFVNLELSLLKYRMRLYRIILKYMSKILFA